jgi:hypothetical protein
MTMHGVVLPVSVVDAAVGASEFPHSVRQAVDQWALVSAFSPLAQSQFFGALWHMFLCEHCEGADHVRKEEIVNPREK